jgi:putative addiction module killer protein
MKELRRTLQFDKWLKELKDARAQARIQTRLDRLEDGNPGVVEPVGGGVSELKIDYGPGYRVYFCERGEVLIIILAGGNKKTQQRDIRNAHELARQL